jgi:hypothetical protein
MKPNAYHLPCGRFATWVKGKPEVTSKIPRLEYQGKCPLEKCVLTDDVISTRVCQSVKRGGRIMRRIGARDAG